MSHEEMSIGELLDIAAAWKKQYQAAEKLDKVLTVLSELESREAVLKKSIVDLETQEADALAKAKEAESDLSRAMTSLEMVNGHTDELARRMEDQTREADKLAGLIRERAQECSLLNGRADEARETLRELDKVHKRDSEVYQRKMDETKRQLEGEIDRLETQRHEVEMAIKALEGKFAELAQAASKVLGGK